MKSSPKPDETPPSTVSKTPVSGRKMVQARLPFKTLSGSEPPFTPPNDTMAAASPNVDNKGAINNENRKRKQSAALTPEDGVRAPKMNRLSKGEHDDDDVILLTVDTMDTSNSKATDKKPEDDQFNQSSESKENVCLENNDENESILLDSDDETVGVVETEAIPNPITSKAKQSLSFSEPKSETRKSKRISDANSIRIKLPMTKKEKESVKKIKKQKKSENNEEKCESSAENKIDATEPSTSVTDQSALNDSILEAENDDAAEMDETMDKNMLNSSTISNVSVDDPSIPLNMLTPKQLQRRAESEKKLLEKQRAKLERERKLQEEKDQKRKEKEEKEEQKRKEREEREEQKRKEKEERDRKIQEEKEQKQREKEERERKVQEEKEQKQREKEDRERKIQEEKEQKLREKEEKKKEREEKERKLLEEKEEKQRKKEEAIVAEKSKIRKTSEAFVKFFVPKKGDGKATTEDTTEENSSSEKTQQHFMSFQVKEGMRMAPIMRRLLNDDERTSLEKIIADKSASSELYLSQLKNNKIIPRKFERTLQDDEDEKCSNDDELFVIDETGEGVQVIEEKPKKFYRAKFFKFEENRRPPYYGTWRKKSIVLGPRKPFVQDSTFFNYEIDSDDDWEEEEPGETLESDDEKDHESEDDYDIDNEFFVPHGHLSDEEWQNEDEFDYENAEDHKIKMQLIQKQFDKEMKKKTQKLKPRVIGLIWQNADGSQPKNCSSGVWNLLNTNSVYFEGESIKIEPPAHSNETLSDDENSNNSKSVRRLKISEKDVPDLIRLINGNTYKIDFLSEEFRAFVAKNNPGQREFTTASIKNKIRELAMHQRCPEDGPMHNKKCWYVPIATRKRYNVNDLEFPNAWTYTIPPRRPIQSCDLENEKQPITIEQKQLNAQDGIDMNDDSNNSCGLSETLTLDSVKQAAMKPTSFNIAKYIRVLSEEEKKKQFDPITMHGPTIDLTADTFASQSSTNKKKSIKKRNSSVAAANVSNAQAGPAQKKRVNLLMSVARGEDFSPKTKNTLVTHFLTTNSKKRQSTDDDAGTLISAIGTRDSSKKKKTEDTVIVIDD